MRSERTPLVMGLTAAAIAAAVAVWYVVSIYQGRVATEGSEVYVGVVGLLLFAQAYIVMHGTLVFSVRSMAVGTALLMLTGFLGMFSIGAPLALAGILAAMATGYVRLRQLAAANRRPVARAAAQKRGR